MEDQKGIENVFISLSCTLKYYRSVFIRYWFKGLICIGFEHFCDLPVLEEFRCENELSFKVVAHHKLVLEASLIDNVASLIPACHYKSKNIPIGRKQYNRSRILLLKR